MSDPSPEHFEHVYHLNRGRLLALPILWAGFVAMLAWAGFSFPESQPGERMAIVYVCGILSAIFLPLVWITWLSRLVLTPEGIAHYQLGYTVRSSWSNLEAISIGPDGQWLRLREPGTRSKLLRGATKVVGGATPGGGAAGVIGDPSLLAQGRLILLTPFMSHWKRGPLRDDIQRCAPHLFSA